MYFSPPKSFKLDDKTIRGLHSWFKGLPYLTRKKVEEGDEPIKLTGFASTTGTVDQNQELARKRVNNVQSYLRDFTGFGAKFKIKAPGELRAKTIDGVEDPKERRVEIEIIGEKV